MDVELNILLLALALAWRGVVGRVLRSWAEGFTGQRSPIAHPALDLLVGLLAGWLAFCVWSAGLTRIVGTTLPLPVFALAEMLVIGAIAAREIRRGRLGWPRKWPEPSTLVRLATVVALFMAVAPRAMFTFLSDSADQDQHVALAVDVARQGIVPDRYEGTDAVIDYPLGFHALAVSASAAIVPPAIVVNALPLLASIMVVALICTAVGAVASRASPTDGDAPAATADLLLLEAGCTVALALALFSGHFSVWAHYVIVPREVGGLCHLVPVLVWASVLAVPSASAASAASADEPGWRATALPVAAMVVSGALIAAVNPTLVPLQAILCATAAITAVLRRRVDWAGAGAGIAAGVLLSGSVVAAVPYLSRLAGVPGLRQAPTADTHEARADFNRVFTNRSCLTMECVATAATSPLARAHAAEPWAALTAGALELLSLPPAPLRYDVPAPGRHRFPDLTGIGLAPVHGRAAPYVFAVLPLLFAAMVAWTRHGPLAWAAASLAGAIAIDGLMRGLLRALVDPFDAGLRLLPYYADVAAAILFSQLLWPLLLVGAAFAGWRADSRRRRAIRLGAAFAIVVPVAVSAAGPVARGMTWGRPFEVPSRADLAALDRLERRVVPEGNTFLVASRAELYSGERWILPADDAVLFYLHARRPTLFLYFLDHTANVGPAGLERTCAALEAGAGDTLLDRYRARWALSVAPPARVLETVGQRLLCGRRFADLFPAMRTAGRDGRLTIVELQPDRLGAAP